MRRGRRRGATAWSVVEERKGGRERARMRMSAAARFDVRERQSRWCEGGRVE
jgi:hypothetical protein